MLGTCPFVAHVPKLTRSLYPWVAFTPKHTHLMFACTQKQWEKEIYRKKNRQNTIEVKRRREVEKGRGGQKLEWMRKRDWMKASNLHFKFLDFTFFLARNVLRFLGNCVKHLSKFGHIPNFALLFTKLPSL
jgi:hypothetical protein